MDLRPRSIGQILDRSITIFAKNAVPLSVIVALTILLDLVVSMLLTRFVFSRLPHGFPLRFNQLMVVSVARTIAVMGVSTVISSVATMAGAVVIEDDLCGARPDIRAAFAEAFGKLGRASVVSLWCVVPGAIVVCAGAADGFAIGSGRNSLFVIGLSIVGIVAILAEVPAFTGVYLAWVHLVLRRADLSLRQLVYVCFTAEPITRTALAVATILIASNAVTLVDVLVTLTHWMPFAAAEALRAGVGIASTVFLISFVTLFYLDLCSRYGGADLEAAAASAGNR